MNKLTFNNAIFLALLFAAILSLADNSFLPSLSKRAEKSGQTTDPCDCACSPVADASKACANSTNLNCGCDAWINSGPSCSACVATVEADSASNITTSFSNAIFGIQIVRAFCLCPDACARIANATYQFGFAGPDINSTCSLFELDGPACSTCIKGFDQYAGLIMNNYVASCKTGANFKNCITSPMYALMQ
jgi:hypothetical protein